jgi:hypothetical protein
MPQQNSIMERALQYSDTLADISLDEMLLGSLYYSRHSFSVSSFLLYKRITCPLSSTQLPWSFVF